MRGLAGRKRGKRSSQKRDVAAASALGAAGIHPLPLDRRRQQSRAKPADEIIPGSSGPYAIVPEPQAHLHDGTFQNRSSYWTQGHSSAGPLAAWPKPDKTPILDLYHAFSIETLIPKLTSN